MQKMLVKRKYGDKIMTTLFDKLFSHSLTMSFGFTLAE